MYRIHATLLVSLLVVPQNWAVGHVVGPTQSSSHVYRNLGLTMPPTYFPSPLPSGAPSALPSPLPTLPPSTSFPPSPAPSQHSSQKSSALPSTQPSQEPTSSPSPIPSLPSSSLPTQTPVSIPSPVPTVTPSLSPTAPPSAQPSQGPTSSPSPIPSLPPSPVPTQAPPQSAVATLAAYPGYTPGQIVFGTVVVKDKADGILVTGILGGLETSTMGGIHIHTGMTCEDAGLVGGHYHPGMSPDPWVATVWHSGFIGSASLNFSMSSFSLTGVNPVANRAVVVHAANGDRIACGVLMLPSRVPTAVPSLSPTATSVHPTTLPSFRPRSDDGGSKAPPTLQTSTDDGSSKARAASVPVALIVMLSVFVGMVAGCVWHRRKVKRQIDGEASAADAEAAAGLASWFSPASRSPSGGGGNEPFGLVLDGNDGGAAVQLVSLRGVVVGSDQRQGVSSELDDVTFFGGGGQEEPEEGQEGGGCAPQGSSHRLQPMRSSLRFEEEEEGEGRSGEGPFGGQGDGRGNDFDGAHGGRLTPPPPPPPPLPASDVVNVTPHAVVKQWRFASAGSDEFSDSVLSGADDGSGDHNQQQQQQQQHAEVVASNTMPPRDDLQLFVAVGGGGGGSAGQVSPLHSTSESPQTHFTKKAAAAEEEEKTGGGRCMPTSSSDGRLTSSSAVDGGSQVPVGVPVGDTSKNTERTVW